MTQPKWVVLEAIPRNDFTLLLSFADGKQGLFSMAPLFDDPYYAPLANPALFMTARTECGTVVWEDDRDIAPELLYDKCQSPEELESA